MVQESSPRCESTSCRCACPFVFVSLFITFAILAVLSATLIGCDGSATGGNAEKAAEVAAPQENPWDITKAPPIPETDVPANWIVDRAGLTATYRRMMGEPPRYLDTTTWIGEPIDLRETRGKVIVIKFWGNWCGACRSSMARNMQLADRYSDQGLVFLGVHSSRAADRAEAYARSEGLNFPSVVDANGVMASRWHVRAWPTYAVIDRWGRVRAMGLRPNHLETMIVRLLNEKAS